ncbi:serpin family protein [Pseudarthrobacter sp. Y6]|uniref:serpin family protein n=1 Tax=Pseudarthrobacter sp. Y6 TaxID=3418422 RepID=UPI003CEC2FC3
MAAGRDRKDANRDPPGNFSDEDATKPAIDAWVNRNTGGRIKEAPRTCAFTTAKGTIAAAVTQINGGVTSAPPQPERSISFDRPFHYQIVHVETGLPLFIGKVTDPVPSRPGGVGFSS